MRLASRVLSTLLVAVAVTACSESPTNARPAAVSLALAPRFSPQAQAIYRSLAAFAVTLDNVHVVVRGAPSGDELGPVLKDTLVAFPATADQVAIEIELEITGSEQRVEATVDLQSGSTIYFEGTQELVAKRGETSTAPEPIAMSYVGPGAAATSMQIFPTISSQPVTIAPLSSSVFTVQAQDQLERVVVGLPVTWRTVDPTIATVSTEGVVTATSKAGSTTLVATGLNGVSAQTTIDVQPVAQLVALRGDNQIGIVGAELPVALTVQAVAANGHFVAGASVTFAALDGLGSVSRSSVTTDLGGLATTALTLGQAIGTYAFTATVAAVPAATTRVTANATAAAAAALGIVSGDSQIDTVTATLAKPLSVRVTDAFGNPVAQQAVDFQVMSQNALLLAAPGAAPATPVRVTTGTDGTAAVSVVGGAIAGTVRVTASVAQSGIAPVAFTLTLNPGNPAMLIVIQQPSPTAQATLPLGTQPVVRVTDRIGNPLALAGLAIIASASTADCVRCTRMAPTGAGGPLLGRTGVASATARARGPTRRLRPAATSTSRLTVPLAIARTQSVSDTFPQGLGGKTQVTTDANGVATFTDLSLDLPVATWQLVFTDARESLQLAFSNQIALFPGPPESLVAASLEQTPIRFAGDSVYPTVRVIDKVGNGVPKIGISWAMLEDGGKLDSLATRTDDNGFSSPGLWQTPVGTNFTVFTLTATSELKLENSPLTLQALLPPPLGRVIPPAQPGPPR